MSRILPNTAVPTVSEYGSENDGDTFITVKECELKLCILQV